MRVASISPASRSERVGPWLLIDTGEPEFSAANSATPLRSVFAEDLDLAVDWFEVRGAHFHFTVRPGIDILLHSELMRRGYVQAPSERCLVVTSPQPPTYDGPLLIREATTDADIETYGRVGWDESPIGIAIARTASKLGFVLLLGSVKGAPVASSMLAATGDIGGLYNVHVETAYRRQGFGTAITWAAVAASLERGAKTIWTGSTDAGYSVYAAMGFEPCFDYLHLEMPRSFA